MAPKKKPAPKAGKRSRTTSVSSTTGVTTRGGARRSKTPALQPVRSSSREASQPAASRSPISKKTHTGRALRSRTKGGDASPLRTGLETATRRSTRQTASPAIQVESTTIRDNVGLNDEELEEQLQQQLVDEATNVATHDGSSLGTPLAPPASSDDAAHDDTILETIEIEAEAPQAFAATQSSTDPSPDSDVEVFEASASVIEIEDDEPATAPQATSAETSVAVETPAKPSEQVREPENAGANEPIEIIDAGADEPIEITDDDPPEQKSEIKEPVKPIEPSALTETIEEDKPAKAVRISPRKRNPRSNRQPIRDAVSPGPDSDLEDGYVRIVDGKDTFPRVPIKTAYKYYKAKSNMLQLRVEKLENQLEEIHARDRIFHNIGKSDRRLTQTERRPPNKTGLPRNYPTWLMDPETKEEQSAKPEPFSIPPEFADFFNPKPPVDFAARIEKMQENDVYDRANKQKDREVAVMRKRRGEELTKEESALVAQIEAEQKAAELEKSLAETPGSFSPPVDDVAMTSPSIQVGTPQQESSPGGKGFAARLMEKVHHFTPTRLFGGWGSSGAPGDAPTTFSTSQTLPGNLAHSTSGGRKRKAETDLQVMSHGTFEPRVATPNPTRHTGLGWQQSSNPAGQLHTQDPGMSSPSVKRQRVDRLAHQTPHYHPVLTPVTERTNETSLLEVLGTPTHLPPQAAPPTRGKRMSLRSAQRAARAATTPQAQAKRDFVSESSNRRQSLREQNVEQDHNAAMYGSTMAKDVEATPTNAGQKRKIFVSRDAPIPQAREGFGFDYDDYDFEDDSTVIDVPEVDEEAELQKALARTTEEYLKLPPSGLVQRGCLATDAEWLKQMQIQICMHGPGNMAAGSKFVNTPYQSSPKPATYHPKPLNDQQKAMLDKDGVIPGTLSTGRTIGVPAYDGGRSAETNAKPQSQKDLSAVTFTTSAPVILPHLITSTPATTYNLLGASAPEGPGISAPAADNVPAVSSPAAMSNLFGAAKPEASVTSVPVANNVLAASSPAAPVNLFAPSKPPATVNLFAPSNTTGALAASSSAAPVSLFAPSNPTGASAASSPAAPVNLFAPSNTTGALAASSPPATVNLFAASNPTGASAPAPTRRAAHEQYKPRQPSRLREETTVQESSESEAEPQPQPPTPTKGEVEFAMFKSMLAMKPGRELQLSPEFKAWMNQPGWDKGMSDWIDRNNNLPISGR